MAVIDEDGTQQLHVTEVKAEGLASAKGIDFFFFLTNKHDVYSASWDLVFITIVDSGCSNNRGYVCGYVQAHGSNIGMST